MGAEVGRSMRWTGKRTVFLVAKLPCRLRFSYGRLGVSIATGLAEELEVAHFVGGVIEGPGTLFRLVGGFFLLKGGSAISSSNCRCLAMSLKNHKAL